MTEAETLNKRLKIVVEALSRILPTWQGRGIKAVDVAFACEVLKSEGWKPDTVCATTMDKPDECLYCCHRRMV